MVVVVLFLFYLFNNLKEGLGRAGVGGGCSLVNHSGRSVKISSFLKLS